MEVKYRRDHSRNWGRTTSAHHNTSSRLARGRVMAATRQVGGTEGGHREQLLQGVTCPEKGSETDTPPVLLIRMPTHTSTHTQTPLHTTHVATPLQTGITAMAWCTR